MNRGGGPECASLSRRLSTSINVRLGQGERVPEQLKPRRRAFRDDHFDDIEPEKNVGIIQEPEPGQTTAGNAFLLVAIDGVKRTPEIFARPRFHFDEDQSVLVAADDVDLAPAPAAKITIEDLVTVRPQEPARQFLAPRSKSKMVGSQRQKPAAPPVRKIGDESDKARVHAILSGAIPCRSLCAG
jgi:hypothetical protein